MSNNDILRRLRYLFNFSDIQVVALFKLADCVVEEADVINWLKKEDDPSVVELTDRELATFLNGLIIEKRGKREGPQPEPEDYLTNNNVLRKLKIALNLKSDDILELFALIDKKISKPELSSFFRHPDHSSFRPLMDQYLRNFLNALQTKSKNKQGGNPLDSEEKGEEM
jgi:uncharacterized protein YehS (DUF1456 family)